MGRLYNVGAETRFVSIDGALRWSSHAQPAALLPDSYKIILSGYSIIFPDLEKNNAYGLDFTTTPFTIYYGASYVTWVPQKWGPLEAGGKYLAPDLVGTVPAGVNYLEVTVNMTRTVAPSNWLNIPIRSLVPQGKPTSAVGGSIACERLNYLARSFEVKLVGTNVYVRRFQSITDLGDYPTGGSAPFHWAPGNATHYSGGGVREGWTHGGRADGHFAALIATASGGSGVYRGGPNSASLSDPTNFSSTYVGTVIIHPGYIPTT